MYTKFSYFLLAFSLLFSNVFASGQDSTSANANSNTQSQPNQAQIDKSEALEFIDPWIALPNYPNNNTAFYLVIKNNSDEDQVLIGASSLELANNVELHNSFIDEKGISKMAAINKLLIPAHNQVELKPGSLHIMLLDLKSKLKAGDKFNIELKFEKLSPKSITCEVKPRK